MITSNILIVLEAERVFSLVYNWPLQGVQVQSEPFISSIALVPLVVRGCNIHFLIQKGGENDAQLLKL